MGERCQNSLNLATKLDHATKQTDPNYCIQCLSTCNIRLYQFLAHCQAKAPFNRPYPYHANGFISHTYSMTTDAMFAPYKSRVVCFKRRVAPPTDLFTRNKRRQNVTRPGIHCWTESVSNWPMFFEIQFAVLTN